MMDALRGGGRALADGWFATAPASRLAASRIVHGAWTTGYLLSRRRMFGRVHRTDTGLFAPVGPCRVLREPLPAAVADRIVDATVVSVAAAAAGIGYRVTGPVAAAMLTWTLAYRNSWSMVFHTDNLVALHAMALGAGRSADALSFDALAARSVGGPAAADPGYGWPLQLCSAATASTYFLAGVAKVAGPLGWGWASGDPLRRQVAVDGIRKELFGTPASLLAYRLYRKEALFRVLAIGSLSVELLAPLALLNRRLGRLWALAAWQMHWGILAIMKIKFRYQMSGAAYSSFADLEHAVAAISRWLKGPS